MSKAPHIASSDGSVTVWYDAGCPLCVREIALMRRMDKRGRLRFEDASSANSCPLESEVLLARLHARQADGSIVSGAAAFAAMWREIPLLRPLGIAAQQPLLLRCLEYGLPGVFARSPADAAHSHASRSLRHFHLINYPV